MGNASVVNIDIEQGPEVGEQSSRGPRTPRQPANNPLNCNRDILHTVIGFVGVEAYLCVSSVSTWWKEAWGQQPTITSRRWAVQSCSCLDWARACGLEIWDEPCLLSAAEGRLDVLQHAVALGYSRPGMLICERAAGGGHLEVVKWCRANRYPWGLSRQRAAEGGHLEVLRWCLANGCPEHVERYFFRSGCKRGHPMDHRLPNIATISAAAGGGHLETVRWCREQGYRWPRETCYMAAKGGHLEMLRWLRANSCPWSQYTMLGAVETGDLGIIEWCRDNGCPWTVSVCSTAVRRGNLNIVKWCSVYDPRGLMREVPCSIAAAYGHLEVVQWLRANGCCWGENICYLAALGDHFEVLRWSIANGCLWNNTSCHRMCRLHKFNGSVSMMVWATANGCPWLSVKSDFDNICEDAAAGGNLEVLRWCVTYREIESRRVSRAAASTGHVHILEWLRASGRLSDGWPDTSLCEKAVSSGSLDMVKWCRANNYPWNERTCAAAARSGNVRLLHWCKANGCP